jgi:hypothetical protein
MRLQIPRNPELEVIAITRATMRGMLPVTNTMVRQHIAATSPVMAARHVLCHSVAAAMMDLARGIPAIPMLNGMHKIVVDMDQMPEIHIGDRITVFSNSGMKIFLPIGKHKVTRIFLANFTAGCTGEGIEVGPGAISVITKVMQAMDIEIVTVVEDKVRQAESATTMGIHTTLILTIINGARSKLKTLIATTMAGGSNAIKNFQRTSIIGAVLGQALISRKVTNLPMQQTIVEPDRAHRIPANHRTQNPSGVIQGKPWMICK